MTVNTGGTAQDTIERLQAKIKELEAEVIKLNKQGQHFGEFIEIIWPLTALKSKVLEKHPEYVCLVSALQESNGE